MKSFDDLLTEAARIGPKRLAVAGQVQAELRTALDEAASKGLANAQCFEDAPQAVTAIRRGEADVLVKGLVKTKDFIRAMLDKENGLRTGRLLSHVSVTEAFGRLLLITDGAINIQPSLEQKVEIIQNAAAIAKKLGIAEPKVAVLAATEVVDPRMPETVDAEKLSKMDIPSCIVQGPLAVDNAINAEAARIKGIEGPVAGQADILLAPSLLVGNVFAKGLMYFVGLRFGGVITGATHPATMLSRSNTARMHLDSIALGIVIGGKPQMAEK